MHHTSDLQRFGDSQPIDLWGPLHVRPSAHSMMRERLPCWLPGRPEKVTSSGWHPLAEALVWVKMQSHLGRTIAKVLGNLLPLRSVWKEPGSMLVEDGVPYTTGCICKSFLSWDHWTRLIPCIWAPSPEMNWKMKC
jgi:hypothetical protein